MSIEVSHLVFNGCSFTYCQGLDDPTTEGWPALLGKTLGLPVVNLAIGGSGNDAILRRTYEYFYQSEMLYPDSKPLYIVAFSDAPRREEFFKKYKGKPVSDYMALDLQASSIDLTSTLSCQDDIHLAVEYSHVMNLSFEACERKKFVSWNSVVNLFKANKIPYLTGDFMPTQDNVIGDYMLTNFKGIYTNALNDVNYAGDLSSLTKHVPKLPCGHDQKEAMPLIADALYDKLAKTYDTINPLDVKYLTLDEYYPPSALTRMYYNPWIN